MRWWRCGWGRRWQGCSDAAVMTERQRVAVITGASGGIGRAAASLLMERGWEVVIATRRPEAGMAVAAALGRGGGAVSWVALDLARLESVRACAREVGERWPRIDALINNAGTVRTTRALSEERGPVHDAACQAMVALDQRRARRVFRAWRVTRDDGFRFPR